MQPLEAELGQRDEAQSVHVRRSAGRCQHNKGAGFMPGCVVTKGGTGVTKKIADGLAFQRGHGRLASRPLRRLLVPQGLGRLASRPLRRLLVPQGFVYTFNDDDNDAALKP